jgi:HEAT repeat protein
MRTTGDFRRWASRLGLTAAPFIVLLLFACTAVEPERPFEEVFAEAEKGNEGAVRQLIRRFGHPDPDEAQRAWDAVVKIGQPTESELIRALGDDDVIVSEHAAGALGSLRSKAAVDSLIAALGKESFRQYVAAWALGEIADPKAIPPLIEALGAKDVEVSTYATRALVKFGPVASPALLAALENDSPGVRHYAVRALGEIKEKKAMDPLLEMSGRVDREVLFWALGRLGDPRGYELLAAAAVDADWKTRLAAIQGLRDLGDARAVRLLEKALGDEEWIVREWAARGLESITGERFTYRDQHGEEVYPYALYR